MAGLLSVGGAVAGTGHFSKVQSTEGNKDVKLERIINKFKAGKKLTSGELSYLSKKSPAIYQKVLRIIQKREQLEERLEAAKTKEEAQQIMMQEMQSIENFCSNSDDDFEKTALVNQMMDAYGEMAQSDSYQEKPDTNAELAKQTMERMGNKTVQEKIKGGKETLFTEGLSSEDNGMLGEEALADGVESIAYEENPAMDTETSDIMTYTAKGTKERASGRTSKKGRLVNVAL